jgi:hypothetical protein
MDRHPTISGPGNPNYGDPSGQIRPVALPVPQYTVRPPIQRFSAPPQQQRPLLPTPQVPRFPGNPPPVRIAPSSEHSIIPPQFPGNPDQRKH